MTKPDNVTHLTHTPNPSPQTRIAVLEAQMSALLRAIEAVTDDTPVSAATIQGIRDLRTDAAT